MLLFSLLFSVKSKSQTKKKAKEIDTILSLRKHSKNSNLDFNKRIEYANHAVFLSLKTKEDSTYLMSNRNLSTLYLQNGDYDSLKRLNTINLKIAKKINDSSSIAYASYNLGFYYEYKLKYDSAYTHYFKALKVFKKLKVESTSSEILINMASIQETKRDYIGAEINAIEAKKLIEKLPENQNNIQTLWMIHNLIGIISGKLKRYDNALKYHDLAYNTTNKMDDGFYYKMLSNSNIASTHRKKGDYTKAIQKYKNILENKNLKNYDASTYASTIANLAHTKFLKGVSNKKEIENPYREAIAIAQNINDHSTEVYTSFYLAKYFESIKRNDSALKYINNAYKISKTTKINEIVLESLILKATITKDSAQSLLMEYITLNNNLVFAERAIRNKFAIINFETETIKQEKEQISRQNLWLIVCSSIFAAISLFVYIIKTRREKRKELEVAIQQQEASEEIYNLMLTQQDKMDQAKALEKKRISQEIHDGVLGRLFGVRLNLDSLNAIKTDDAVVERNKYINELKTIEFDIRKVSHDLNTDFVSNSSFLEIIKTLIKTQCTAYGLNNRTTVDKDINCDTLSNKTKLHIYRIIQEILQNIYKHAEANLVTLKIIQNNNTLSITISDNGKGYDANKKKDGIGLKNIKSRVKVIKAKLYIKTIKNKGTKTTIEVQI